MPPQLLFADYAPKTLEPKNSIGAKWIRLLDRLDLSSAVKDKRTAIKMHLGGGTGFTVVHPFFVRTLVDKVKEAGAKDVFATDSAGAVKSAAQRGYAPETIGCRITPVDGTAGRYFYARPVEPPISDYTETELAGEIVDAEALIDLSHVKGHGETGFGGASKNLSMGCVTDRTRGKIHGIEGYLEWDAEKCDHCEKCKENCADGALSFNDKGEFSVFWHNCKLCQHCVLICPNDAIKPVGGTYEKFQRAMAQTSSMVLGTFAPENVVFINLLMNITIYCDCWGMTTPSLVPDIGILAGRDIVAIEQASLDMIRTEELIPRTLPPGTELGDTGHLFERIHRRDPYEVVKYLAELGHGSRQYEVVEVE